LHNCVPYGYVQFSKLQNYHFTLSCSTSLNLSSKGNLLETLFTINQAFTGKSATPNVTLRCSAAFPNVRRVVGHNHRVGRVLSFFSNRRNGDSPNPSPAGECAPPPRFWGRGTVAGDRRTVWRVLIPTGGAYTVVIFKFTYILDQQLVKIFESRSRIHEHERTRFLGIILRVLRLEVSVWIS
jgi:hypothetical protein